MLRHALQTTRALTAPRFAAQHARSFATGGRVKLLGSDDAYDQLTKAGSGKKAIVYFTAKWCPPCKMISPVYDELSSQYTDIEFAKVDVDELDETAAKAGVRSMPTFYLFDNGTLQRGMSFSGADEALLRDVIKKLNDL
ncbi:TPA: hypothetical protein N0F65_002875 [Lagenidium giganteum]|uniref:Thioredoxin domain-containing protein n=1 Tax=Lagenidium giganteum TaxID=4803 RepID=A0AAV2ZD29_9STRA|nr:TPA: hypothetical protein N0F65_002875 [Lagenidium giganteum]